MKIIKLLILSIILTIFIIYSSIPITANIIPILYNIIGIVFSIGMGLIITFSMSGIENKNYILKIRCNIKHIRNNFITLFSICTILLIVFSNIKFYYIYNINIRQSMLIFTTIFFLLSIVYFILNFIKLQELNEEIFDRVLKERTSNKN